MNLEYHCQEGHLPVWNFGRDHWEARDRSDARDQIIFREASDGTNIIGKRDGRMIMGLRLLGMEMETSELVCVAWDLVDLRECYMDSW